MITTVITKIRKKIVKDGVSGLIKYLCRHFTKIPKSIFYHMYFYRIANKSFMGLNLGSGNAIIEGFCNIDASLLSICDVIAGADKLKLSDNSVGVIYNSHVFEHFPREIAKGVLFEWYRLLKPGGKLYISVPDVETLFRLYLDNLPLYGSIDGEEFANSACSVVYGGQMNKYDYHFYGYSFTTLKALLESAGFRDIRRFDIDALMLYKGMSAANATIAGKPISLNVEALK